MPRGRHWGGPPWARDDGGGGGWSGGPPWWPEGEPWPPADAAGWRVARRRFMRRAALFVGGGLLLLTVLVALLVWLVLTVFGYGIFTLLAGLVVVIGFALVARRAVQGFRGSAVGMGELIEAAGRVEAGEVGAQVEVHGPSEVRSLAQAFNAMSARLAEDRDQRHRLLADVSHELRTPLTVIQGSLEGILDGIYPADEEHLAPILDETRVLGRLIDDLRTLTLAETGQLSLHREPTDLAALCTDVAAGFRAAADAAGVSLAVETDADLLALEVDPERLRQVLANLVANALRYTPAGGRIGISVARLDGGVRITVRDSGQGMSPEELERVFERFYRSSESRGSGLGLPIARELVRAHGGELTASSQPGAGTSVEIGLPG